VKVENFKPEELIVKTVDNTVQVSFFVKPFDVSVFS
jgi:hypothetical protein